MKTLFLSLFLFFAAHLSYGQTYGQNAGQIKKEYITVYISLTTHIEIVKPDGSSEEINSTVKGLHRDCNRILNRFGKEGWSLVNASNNVFILERELKE